MYYIWPCLKKRKDTACRDVRTWQGLVRNCSLRCWLLWNYHWWLSSVSMTRVQYWLGCYPQLLLLYLMREGNSHVDIDIPSAEAHLPSNPETLLRFSFFFLFVCLCFVLFFKTLLKQLKLLNIKGTKAIPLGSTDGSDSFQAHTSLCLRTKLHREQRGHRLPFASNFRLLLRRNVWPCVPAKRGLQKLADLI